MKSVSIDSTISDTSKVQIIGKSQSFHVKTLSKRIDSVPVLRHNPVIDVVEPKVYSPYIAKPGSVPRQIEIERKKRLFAKYNINETLHKNGVISCLLNYNKNIRQNSIDSFPLSMFDDLEYETRSLEFWISNVNKSSTGLPARAKCETVSSHGIKIEWKQCHVIKGNANRNEFEVTFVKDNSTHDAKKTLPPALTQLSNAEVPDLPDENGDVNDVNEVNASDGLNNASSSVILERIFICFNAEDPENYCKRIASAIKLKEQTNSSLALNLYVDCMPTDNMRTIDTEQISRIRKHSVTSNQLRDNHLDISGIIKEYNLNHVRTLNQLAFANILKKNLKNVSGMQLISSDHSLFINPAKVFQPCKFISVVPLNDSNSDFTEQSDITVTYSDNSQKFRFKSLYSKLEANRILLQIQTEVTNLDKLRYSTKPEKTLRLDEFLTSQQTQSGVMMQTIKESFINSVINSVKINLKDVKKGWFNIEESNYEVYSFSRLKQFLVRINLMMEDTLRNVMYRCAETYISTIESFIPKSVEIISNSNILKIDSTPFPLFIVDLKFVGPSGNSSSDGKSSFIYSSSSQAIFDGIMSIYDQSFDLLKNILNVEYKIMRKLFWASKPVILIPNSQENWAKDLRARLVSKLNFALGYMDEYLLQLNDFLDIISLDIKTYTTENEKKFCSGENPNLIELCQLAEHHIKESDDILHRLPSSINLGFVLIDCKSVKQLLSIKHKNISSKLFEILEKKAREYAEVVSEEFREIFDKLSINPYNVEQLTEMKEFLSSLPIKIDALGDKISTCTFNFDLLESAKWQVPYDYLDLKWEVFKWPLKMSSVSFYELLMCIFSVILLCWLS